MRLKIKFKDVTFAEDAANKTVCASITPNMFMRVLVSDLCNLGLNPFCSKNTNSKWKSFYKKYCKNIYKNKSLLSANSILIDGDKYNEDNGRVIALYKLNERLAKFEAQMLSKWFNINYFNHLSNFHDALKAKHDEY